MTPSVDRAQIDAYTSDAMAPSRCDPVSTLAARVKLECAGGGLRRASWAISRFYEAAFAPLAVQHCLKPAPQTLQLERVSRSELNLDPTVGGGLPSGDRQCRLSHVNAQNRQSQRGDVKSVLAGPAARIEHRSSESAFGCQPHYCCLRLANIPRRRPSWYDASQGSPVSRS